MPALRSPRRLLNLTCGLVLACIILVLACAYPARDDWTWALLGHEQGWWGGLSTHWHHWSGRWAYTLVMLTGGTWGHWYVPTYALWPLATVAAMAWAARGLTATWSSALAVTVAACLMPGAHEALAWHSGVVGYVLPMALGAALLTQERQPIVLFLAGVVLGGWTETPAIVLAGWCIATADRAASRWYLAGEVLGLAVLLSAPGNAERVALVGGWKPLVPALTNALESTLQLTWMLVAAPWLPALALVLPARPAHALWRSGVLLAVAVAAVAASTVSVGFAEPRQQATIWLHLFVVLGSLALSLPRPVLVAWIAGASLMTLSGEDHLGPWVGSGVLLGMAGWAWRRRALPPPEVLLAITLLSAPATLTWLGDVPRAPAWRWWHHQRDAQVEALVAAGITRVRLPVAPLELRPATSVGDLVSSGDWLAQAWARWHGLDAVRLEPQATAVSPW